MKKILTILAVIAISMTLTACKDDNPNTVFDVPEEGFINKQELPYADYLKLTNPEVSIEVEGMGTIVLQLFPEAAPNTVNNFINYIENEVYENNEFHRVINGFMIQGGRLASPDCTIEGEMPGNMFPNPLHHWRGVISMARVGGNYDSASSQFFIMHEPTSSLDGEYAPFGGVISGFNVLDFIANLNDNTNEVPSVPVIITNITVDLKGESYDEPICITE